MHTQIKNAQILWVSCPACGFPFSGGPEYLDPALGFPAPPEALERVELCCPKCRRTFVLEESKTKPPLMPEHIPTSLKELP